MNDIVTMLLSTGFLESRLNAPKPDSYPPLGKNDLVYQKNLDTWIHEIGHAQGLEHSTKKEDAPQENRNGKNFSYCYSLMTYNRDTSSPGSAAANDIKSGNFA